MKRLALPLAQLALVFTVLTLSSCKKKHTDSYTYTIYSPVFKNRAEVINGVASHSPKSLSKPGKIFIKGNYLLVNEINKGIHVIDNSEPTHPKNIAFIDIPLNTDLAMRGNYLYANLGTEMLTINISDPGHAKVESVLSNVFPSEQGFAPTDPSLILADVIMKDTTVHSEWYTTWPRLNFQKSSESPLASYADAGKGLSGAPGIGGSSARFALLNNYLYTATIYSLGTYSLADPARPDSLTQQSVGWGIETIFPFRNNLLLGSTSGVFIYDISDPEQPSPKGSFSHLMACDPVIADGKYAYVTLRDGTTCSNAEINELNVLDITNLSDPLLIKTYPMHHPYGLAKDGNYLFICDGSEGLKIYDATDPMNHKLISKISDFETSDVIAWDDRLIITGADGIYQYSYTNIKKPTLLSKIASK